MPDQPTKRDELKSKVADIASKYGAARDNHSTGLEYLALEILAHQPVLSDELLQGDERELDVRRFHTGGPNDGGIDGIIYNQETTHVYIVQAKYKDKPMDSDTLEEARSFFGRLDEWINPKNRHSWNSDTIRLLDEVELTPKQQEIFLYFFTSMTAKEKPLYQNLAEEFTNSYGERGYNVRCEILTRSDILDLMNNSYSSQEHSLVPNKLWGN